MKRSTPRLRYLGFGGKKMAGKTTAAVETANILKIQGYKVIVIGFAKKLKEICASIAGVSYEEACTREFKTKFIERLGMTGRELFQKVGVGMRESLGANVWINLLRLSVEDKGYDFCIIHDVRFQNERDFILSDENWHLFRLESALRCAPNVTTKTKSLLDKTKVDISKQHISETDLDDPRFWKPEQLYDADKRTPYAIANSVVKKVLKTK